LTDVQALWIVLLVGARWLPFWRDPWRGSDLVELFGFWFWFWVWNTARVGAVGRLDNGEDHGVNTHDNLQHMEDGQKESGVPMDI